MWVQLRRDGVVPGAGPDIEADCETSPGTGDCELYVKVFCRNGDLLDLHPQSYEALKETFSDDRANDLSDHYPVAVVFEYLRMPPCGDATGDGKITAGDALKNSSRRGRQRDLSGEVLRLHG